MEKVGGDFSMQKGGVVIAYVRVRLLAVDAVEQSRQAAATLQELLFDNRSPFSYIVVADFTTGGSADIYFFSNLPSVAPPVVDRAGSDSLKRRLVDAVNLALPLRVAPFVGTFTKALSHTECKLEFRLKNITLCLLPPRSSACSKCIG